MTVYVLQHVSSIADGNEDVKFIGVYSSQDAAQAALIRLAHLPGFSESPNGFHIDAYPLDKDHWVEGFMSVTKADSQP